MWIILTDTEPINLSKNASLDNVWILQKYVFKQLSYKHYECILNVPRTSDRTMSWSNICSTNDVYYLLYNFI